LEQLYLQERQVRVLTLPLTVDYREKFAAAGRFRVVSLREADQV
jgi:hypothetical protein